MKKVLFFALFLTTAGLGGLKAQVRIGGNEAPHTAAVLDLNPANTSTDGQLGLSLPRVNLTSGTDPLNGVQPIDGTLVYNTNSGLGEGLYYCVSGNWIKIGEDSGSTANVLEAAGNGLTKSNNTVLLGGTLTKDSEFNTATGYHLYTTGPGKFGVGALPAATSAKFEVDGAAANKAAYNAGNGTAIDFSRSNLAYTTASAGAFTLTNLKDGATYTLAVQGTTSGTASFTNAKNTNGDPVTVKILNTMATLAGKQTLYTIIVMGTTAYVFVNTGF